MSYRFKKMHLVPLMWAFELFLIEEYVDMNINHKFIRPDFWAANVQVWPMIFGLITGITTLICFFWWVENG